MGDDEDDDANPSLGDVVYDAGGNVRWRRILAALRGRNSGDRDLVPLFLAGLVLSLVGGPVWGFLAASETVLGGLGSALVIYAAIAFIAAWDRTESYYADDEEIAVEELRSRYAEGEFGLEAFQRRVDRVYEEGPEFVWADEDEADSEDRDPVTILRERYARGEIDHDEYRRRMRGLGEPIEDDEAADPIVEREG